MIVKNIYKVTGSDSCIPDRKDFENVIQELINLDCHTVQIDHNQAIVRDYWFGFINPSFAYLLQGVSGYTDVELYPSTCSAFKDEVGTVGNIRFIKNRSSLFGQHLSQYIIFVGSFGNKDNPVSKKLKKNPSMIDFSNPHHVQYLEGILMVINKK